MRGVFWNLSDNLIAERVDSPTTNAALAIRDYYSIDDRLQKTILAMATA